MPHSELVRLFDCHVRWNIGSFAKVTHALFIETRGRSSCRWIVVLLNDIDWVISYAI